MDKLDFHAGDRNTCTRQEIPLPCQLGQLYEVAFSSSPLVSSKSLDYDPKNSAKALR